MNFNRISRLAVLSGLLIVVALTGAWWVWQTAGYKKVPVVIYLVDSLRADRLEIYGYTERPTSPNLVALAKESVVFEQAHAAAPWTLPSVASIITSVFPCEHQIFTGRNRLSSSFNTLPEVLRDLGYFTGGAYSNLWVGPGNGLADGYQKFTFSGGADQEHAPEVHDLLGEAGDKPFYFYLHSMEPHDTHATLSEYISALGHVPVDLRLQYKDMHERYVKYKEADWEAHQPLGTTDNTALQDEAKAFFADNIESLNLLYDASVLRADSNLGDVIAELKKSGAWDETLFIFVSDHGEEVGDHGGWFHDQSVYEELTRVPMLIHFPDREFAGQRIANQVSLLDIMPTVLDYLGRSKLCQQCRGKSLMSIIDPRRTDAEGGKTVQSLRTNVRTFYAPMKHRRGDVNISLRDGKWKGIFNLELDAMEIYDLEADPGELRNLAGEHPELVSSLKDRATTWFKSCVGNARLPDGPAALDEETKARLRAMGYLN